MAASEGSKVEIDSNTKQKDRDEETDIQDAKGNGDGTTNRRLTSTVEGNLLSRESAAEVQPHWGQ